MRERLAADKYADTKTRCKEPIADEAPATGGNDDFGASAGGDDGGYMVSSGGGGDADGW